MLESLEGKRGDGARQAAAPGDRRACSASRPSINNVLTPRRGADDPRPRAARTIATSASAARAARRSSSSPATSSRAASSRRRSASPCASSSRTTAAARASGPPGPGRAGRRPARRLPAGRRSSTLPMDYEAFAEAGAMVGHGGIVVFDDTVDMARQARFAMEFCADRVVRQVHAVPHRLRPRRRGDRPDHRRRRTASANLVLLEDLCETMTDGSLCAMGGLTPDAGAQRARATSPRTSTDRRVPTRPMNATSRHHDERSRDA